MLCSTDCHRDVAKALDSGAWAGNRMPRNKRDGGTPGTGPDGRVVGGHGHSSIVLIHLCPYCADMMTDDNSSATGRTSDHVFWAAFGARATVSACRGCNSRIGSEIEGKLSPGNELYARGKWRGTVRSDGRDLLGGAAVDVDLETSDVRLVKPVTSHDVGDERHLRLTSSPEHVRRLMRSGVGAYAGLSAAEIDDLIDNAPVTPWHPTVDIEIRHDLSLGRRLAAKMLLGAGALADPDFVTSALAESLRDVLWARLSPIELVSADALPTAIEVFDLPGLGDAPLIDLSVAAGQAVFVPLARRNSTMLFARMNKHLVGGSGFVLSGSWPRAHELPVVVEDRVGGAVIRFVIEDLFRWTSQQAELSISSAAYRPGRDIAPP